MPDTSIRQSSETQDNQRFILLKTEKLSVAIHMVTSHLSAQEPVREDLRRMSLRLVKDVRMLVSDEEGMIASDTAHLGGAAEALISGLYVAKSVKLISQGNASILESEYHELRNYFDNNKFVNKLEHTVQPAEVEPRQVASPIRHISDKRQTAAPVTSAYKTEHKNDHKNDLSHADGPLRKEMILNIIEGKNSYSLGEVASKIKGVSEKTVQRDLLSLVQGKILKKAGERRWSRYMRA